MSPVAGTHYLAGPVIAFAVIAGLALFLRWAFRGEPRRRPPADDGLLTRVATLSREDSAQALRAVLADAGPDGVLEALGGCLSAHFDVAHSTLQIETPAYGAHESALHA